MKENVKFSGRCFHNILFVCLFHFFSVLNFNTTMKLWRGNIFIAVCLCEFCVFQKKKAIYYSGINPFAAKAIKHICATICHANTHTITCTHTITYTHAIFHSVGYLKLKYSYTHSSHTYKQIHAHTHAHTQTYMHTH